MEQYSKYPDEIAQELSQTVTLPLMVCAQDDPRICYRITGEERVEDSQDGGQTWQVVWQLPTGRRRFMEAYHQNRVSICRTMFAPGPYDLALLAGQDKAPTLIVAMGSE